MVLGGFKTLAQDESAIADGKADVVGLVRALVVDPELPSYWLAGQRGKPSFPCFKNSPDGSVVGSSQLAVASRGTVTDMPL